MAQQLAHLHYLDQSVVASHLAQYAPDLTGYNSSGGVSIDGRVLKEFARLTPDAVWSRSALHWRAREPHDQPGRMQY